MDTVICIAPISRKSH